MPDQPDTTEPTEAFDPLVFAKTWIGRQNYSMSARGALASAAAQVGILEQLTRIANMMQAMMDEDACRAAEFELARKRRETDALDHVARGES